MKPRFALIGLLTGIALLFLFSSTLLAQEHRLLLPPGQQTPTLGFYGQNSYDGIYVVDVIPGSQAAGIGLERGDVVLSVNGRRIWNLGMYHRAMRQAANSGGHVTLLIRNWRTGRNELRYVQLYGQPSPPPVLLYEESDE